MSNEPGLTLGRLVAAERNALAALQAAKRLTQENADLRDKVTNMQKETILMRDQISAMQVQMAGLRGSGATER